MGETNARARLLAEQLDRPDYLFPLLNRQFSFHLIRGEHKLALSLAQQVEEIGQTRGDAAMVHMGRASHGWMHFFAGEFVAARTILAQTFVMSDPAARAAIRAACATVMAEDPHVVILGYLAVTLGYLEHVPPELTR